VSSNKNLPPIQPKMTVDEFIALGKTPSKLIRLTVTDMEKCEASEVYQIDMGYWHQPLTGYLQKHARDSNAVCVVCAGGSVMAQEIGLTPQHTADFIKLFVGAKDPTDDLKFYRDIQVLHRYNAVWDVFHAIDYFRRGWIGNGLAVLDISERDYEMACHAFQVPAHIDWPTMIYYEHDPAGFKREMRAMADFLERIGL
jgi:hypothetical protein